MSSPAAEEHAPATHAPSGSTARLALGALGVVYGDIGTSPLYAAHECFTHRHGVDPTADNVLGVLSLIFWSLTLVVVVKYLTFIMRADNRGEGGILALLALVAPRSAAVMTRTTAALVMLGLFGAALLYGDGVITPAISVLSAVEGLGVATPAFNAYVIPITVGILIGLFMFQKRGTAGVGAIFGPATLLWFVTIAVIGVPWIARHPGVFWAVNPIEAVRFFVHHRAHGFFVLGSVVLCVTGGEALYADMGHFGRAPIRLAWYAIVFPALLLNYFGQGALLLEQCGDLGSAACVRAWNNPFYSLVGGWLPHAAIYPLVMISTIATVVASQALISGAYSLTQQAMQLGYSPRVTIVHTSGEAVGQIYVPEVNAALMVACVALVLGFKESSALAAAYGIAVTGTMSITSILFYRVARERWHWSRGAAVGIVALFLVFDLSFFAANVVKVKHGGWVPIAIATMVFVVMTTWKRGRATLSRYVVATMEPIEQFLDHVRRDAPPRVPGAAVFMTQHLDGVPPALTKHYRHNRVLHEKMVLLSVHNEPVPEVDPTERVDLKDLGGGFWQIVAHVGFMESPDVPEIMRLANAKGLVTEIDHTTFFLGRETILTTGHSGMARWRKTLFSLLARNARPATSFFRIPPNRVIELGAQLEL